MSASQPGQLPFRFLATDGTDVYFENGGTLQSLTQSGQLAFFFLIDLDRCDRDIDVKSKETGSRFQRTTVGSRKAG